MLHRRTHNPNIQTSSVFYIPMKLRLSRSDGAAALRFYGLFYGIMRKGLLQNSPFFLRHRKSHTIHESTLVCHEKDLTSEGGGGRIKPQKTYR